MLINILKIFINIYNIIYTYNIYIYNDMKYIFTFDSLCQTVTYRHLDTKKQFERREVEEADEAQQAANDARHFWKMNNGLLLSGSTKYTELKECLYV